jgi:hypothetical protein
VALPMDEQRILEEMERMLAADDPRLAAKLAAFGQPGVAQVLRTRRARAALSLLMLAVIAAAAAVIYLVSAFRIGSGAPSVPPGQQTSQQASTRPVHRTVPLPAPAHCIAQVAPRTCAAWSGGSAQGISITPGGAGTQAAGGSQGPRSGQATHPAEAGKP